MIAPLLVTASLLVGVQTETLTPPSGPLRLAYTHTAEDQVAFMDLASIERAGDVAQAWGLIVMPTPVSAFDSPPAEVFWTRIRIDCAARVGRFTHAVALAEGAVVFNQPVVMEDTPTEGGWALDEAYACRNDVQVREIVESAEEAIRAAREHMAGGASNAAH